MRLRLLILGLSVIGLAAVCPPVQAEVLAHWVAIGPEGRVEARAVTDEAVCPALTIDGSAVLMELRAEPNVAHAVRVCSLAIPAGAVAVQLAGHSFPLPKTPVERIVVIGDAGCRIKNSVVQDCGDPGVWPFAAIAKRAAALAPDLVIHTGDYLYRESPCPQANPSCAGSPYGDTWPTWEADLFAPAAELLRAAPWIMTRGNHEICARGGVGWTRLLDPTCTTRRSPACRTASRTPST